VCFGLANICSSKRSEEEIFLHTQAGISVCLAPAILSFSTKHGTCVDCKSFGVMLCYMVAEALTFDLTDQALLFSMIMKCEYMTPAHFSEES
jgi:hypothetical protein